MDRLERKKVGVALVVVAVMIGTAVTAVTVAPAFGRPQSGSFSMSIEIVPWHENESFWVWVPVMLQDRSPNWLQFTMQPRTGGVDWHIVNGSEGTWLNVSGNQTVRIDTWATIEDVSRATGLQWSALVQGPEGQPRLLFAAGGEGASPIAVRLVAIYSAGNPNCPDTARASEMLAGDGQLRPIGLEVRRPC